MTPAAPASPVPSASNPAPATAQPPFQYTPEYVAFLNQSLATRTPQEILEWALISLPGLVQTTAFGLTGLAILDMISKIRVKQAMAEHPVPLIFIDTLYHFPETLALANKAASHFSAPLQIYHPVGFSTSEAFEAHHGKELWKADADVYDFLVKVEPGRRAALENNAQATITGRRRSQGAARATIPILEIDNSVTPAMLKLNVLATWGYDDVWKYIQENGVPYNELHDKGYKSVGDWHSTAPTAEGESERDGRWKGQEKTECGLHKDYFKMRSSYLAAKKRKVAQRGDADEIVLVDEVQAVNSS
ncbi:phosphoadenosine phosphosulfate reductase [Chytriomyces sp. MP71]|nr:phosphoadenosine phosphosulfate reductase [Chytriomyces sp. MP71]